MSMSLNVHSLAEFKADSNHSISWYLSNSLVRALPPSPYFTVSCVTMLGFCIVSWDWIWCWQRQVSSIYSRPRVWTVARCWETSTEQICSLHNLPSMYYWVHLYYGQSDSHYENKVGAGRTSSTAAGSISGASRRVTLTLHELFHDKK